MKIKELFKTYAFTEIYPYLGLMYPKARHQRKPFEHAYNMLLDIKPVTSKKQIRYELMQDPDTNEMFFGADDSAFNGPWDVLLGKELKREPNVELSEEEILANCLLNFILIGKHPRLFEEDYQSIIR